MAARLTPDNAKGYAAAIARMMLHGQECDAAQLVLLIGSAEYERGKEDMRLELEVPA